MQWTNSNSNKATNMFFKSTYNWCALITGLSCIMNVATSPNITA